MYEIRKIINQTTKESILVESCKSIKIGLNTLKKERVKNPQDQYYMTLASITQISNDELKEGIEQWPTTTKRQ